MEPQQDICCGSLKTWRQTGQSVFISLGGATKEQAKPTSTSFLRDGGSARHAAKEGRLLSSSPADDVDESILHFGAESSVKGSNVALRNGD